MVRGDVRVSARRVLAGTANDSDDHHRIFCFAGNVDACDERQNAGLSVGTSFAPQEGMDHDKAKIDALRGQIIGCAIEVHREMGPGLLESVYQTCLIIELRGAGLQVGVNQQVPLHYHGRAIDQRLFIDLLVQDLVVLEVKSVERLVAVHTAQVITYLKLANKPAGLLLNFNCVLMKDGIRRVTHPAIIGPTHRRPSSTLE